MSTVKVSSSQSTRHADRLLREGGAEWLRTKDWEDILGRWVDELRLDCDDYGTHSIRRTKAKSIYRRTKNLRTGARYRPGTDDNARDTELGTQGPQSNWRVAVLKYAHWLSFHQCMPSPIVHIKRDPLRAD